MKLKFRPLFVTLLLSVCLVSCGGTDQATLKLLEELNSGYGNDGRQVELTGHLGVPRGFVLAGDVINIGLYDKAGQSGGDRLASLRIKFGREPNGYYIPGKFSGGDVEIYDNAGVKHGYMTKVKITGTVGYTNKDWKERLDREPDDNPMIPDAIREIRLKERDKSRQAAEERERLTGDPNDYSFEIAVDKITAL